MCFDCMLLRHPPPLMLKAIVWDEEGWIVCSLITRWKGSRNRPSSVILHFFCLAPQRASIFRTCVSASFTDADMWILCPSTTKKWRDWKR